MVVPDVIAPSLLLKVVQSPELSAPLLAAEAVGILKVWVLPDDEMPISKPDVPDAKVCIEPVSPFNEVMVFPLRRFDNERAEMFPDASVVKILVLIILFPKPENLTLPVVCNCANGLLVPIPTLPANLK